MLTTLLLATMLSTAPAASSSPGLDALLPNIVTNFFKRGAHQNPFDGAQPYINPDYRALARASALKAPSRGVAQAMLAAGSQPTAVWLDTTDAIVGGYKNSGRKSLRQHIDLALAQARAQKKPGLMTIVVYNLPDRDCAAAASNGQLKGVAGLEVYKRLYIDAIHAALTADKAYEDMRFVLVVEPDSLPNLVTNSAVPGCAAAVQQKLYEQGVAYAIRKLGALPNAYVYLDMAHSGWLGWPSNLVSAVALYSRVIKEATADGKAQVAGIATNISNYTPLREPHVTPNDPLTLGDSFYEYNPVFDERSFVEALSKAFAEQGLTQLGYIIDTSRNGWSDRGSALRVDARKHRGNWCNVKGAGIGERPRAIKDAKLPLLDAYVWVKPPGESDGASMPGVGTAGSGKRFDRNCDPRNPALDAMDGAPEAGQWFDGQFRMLVKNAQPPL